MELILLPFFILFDWLWPCKNTGDVKISDKGRMVINNRVLADKVHRAIQKMNAEGKREATIDGLTVRRV